LILNLEQTDNVEYAHPLPGSFTKPRPADGGEYCSCFFMGLSIVFQPNGAKTVDLTPAVTDFTQVVKDWPVKSTSMDIRVRYVRR
jgi:poly(A) polymerase Pap1